MPWQQNNTKNNFPPKHQESFCSFVLQICSQSRSTGRSKKIGLRFLNSHFLSRIKHLPLLSTRSNHLGGNGNVKLTLGSTKKSAFNIYASLGCLFLTYVAETDSSWLSCLPAYVECVPGVSRHLKAYLHLLVRQILERVSLMAKRKKDWKQKQALIWRHFTNS